MTPVIEAKGLAKRYGAVTALHPSSFTVPPGQILGLIGANGAGKTTLLNAVLGLIGHEGDLKVFGLEPLRDRARLMQQACFIADVATLPRWLKVSELLNIVAGLHPKFDKEKARAKLIAAQIPFDRRIKAFSKGMVVQTHLAIVLAIDARLLVLDEPTLGLDIINRRAFYDAILTEYFDDSRTIIITTHQVEEIEHVLTHVMMIRNGAIQLQAPIDEIEQRYTAVDVASDKLAAAQALKPIYQRAKFGRTTCVFDGLDRATAQSLGDIGRVGLADLFVALNEPDAKLSMGVAA